MCTVGTVNIKELGITRSRHTHFAPMFPRGSRFSIRLIKKLPKTDLFSEGFKSLIYWWLWVDSNHRA